MFKNREKEVLSILIGFISMFLFIGILTYNPFDGPINNTWYNYTGPLGVWLSYYGMKYFFGYGTIFIPISGCLVSYILFFKKDIKDYSKIFLYMFYLCIWLSSFLYMLSTFQYFSSITIDSNIADITYSDLLRDGSGYFGIIINQFLYEKVFNFKYFLPLYYLGNILFLIIIVSGLFRTSMYDWFYNMPFYFKSLLDKNKNNDIIEESMTINNSNKDEEHITDDIIEESMTINNSNKDEEHITDDIIEESMTINNSNEDESSNIDEVANDDITVDDEKTIAIENLDSEKDRRNFYFKYSLPKTELLFNPVEIKQDQNILIDKSKQLVYYLQTFGVEGKVVKISSGPIISLFEVEPAEGVRVNKFLNLADDLARVMKASKIRILAPIPGSQSVGVEIPNDSPATVYLKTIFNSEKFVNSESKLTIGLGKTTTGDAFIFDLSKMPHLLVAGATGSGKSVCINTIIVSILYKAKPDEVKFILIDPKKLELSTYKSLVGYHLSKAPNIDEYVMTTPENAVGVLNSAIAEMERRFTVFSEARVRSISEYHVKYNQDETLEKIPFLVVLIDELADLMITSGRAVEEPITRLAQKARAVGIHLVVATQRPSVDVITGLIKSNFPARIAFQVSSKIDSRTIIDQMGAEKLLGRGDMLFLSPSSMNLTRLHNALITLDEIEKIMEHITNQSKPKEEVLLPKVYDKVSENNNFSLTDNHSDELLYEASKLVVDNQQASVSLLQRKLRIGYSRAGRIIDELESLGIISGYSGSKARDVLVDMSYIENIFKNS